MRMLGARLKQLRESAGYSQRSLARRTGVSNATISMIERDALDPSLGLFKRILDGIPYSISAFFSEVEENEGDKPRFAFRRADFLEIGTAQVSCRQVGRDLTGVPIQIMHERYAPGCDTGRAPLVHDAFEGGVVIKGLMELTVGERKEVLRQGDGYLFDSRIPHRFKNVGEAECEVISVCTPPSF